MTQGQPDSVNLENGASGHGGTPKVVPEEQRVTWLELFFDLLFVVAFDQLAKRLGDTPSAENIGLFLLLFAAVWWAWVGNTTFAARYGNGERVYRWGSLLQLLTLGVLALTERGDLDQTGQAFALAYAANRWILVGMHLLHLRRRTETASFSQPLATGYGLAALIWLGSALLTGSVQLVAWGVALGIDVLTPLLLRQRHGAALPHQEHLPERMGLLQIIALGSIMTEVVAGGRQQSLTGLNLFPALCAMLLAVGLWRLYFDQARTLPVLHAHWAGRVGAFLMWLYGHFPFTLSVTMLAVGLGHGISDTENERDAVNRQLVAWPLAGALLTLALLRGNALRLTARSLLGDRSLLALGAGTGLAAALAFCRWDTLALHAGAAALTLLLALIVATDPVTRQLGRIEERLGGSGSPV
ncbi:low temperature requirement protein A [Deinococcus sp. YIM 77859]|uniref:low temperature requirement protein A n=1 Tax=Deinococcus sp. YIM 77859 TaxID=1540221 RepID=UPI0005536F0E|nr:low temperature requirement protein A [Deinococcus sp. YIM 77859]